MTPLQRFAVWLAGGREQFAISANLKTDDYWRTRYASDPGLLGSEVRLNGRPYTVIGITPATFRGRMIPGVGSDFWVPYSMYPHLSPQKRILCT